MTFSRDADVDDRIAGIARIEEILSINERWITHRLLNGDQSNQGRELSMSPHEVRLYRVTLYHYGR